jgi:hypothetical protein
VPKLVELATWGFEVEGEEDSGLDLMRDLRSSSSSSRSEPDMRSEA